MSHTSKGPAANLVTGSKKLNMSPAPGSMTPTSGNSALPGGVKPGPGNSLGDLSIILGTSDIQGAEHDVMMDTG